ncbi:hypothetical protein AGMMS4957_03390 [Bacteroidia bacterium]|nr:hypothetical protein AGMMS4957_03390 [Bacteroidia bacterium]
MKTKKIVFVLVSLLIGATSVNGQQKASASTQQSKPVSQKGLFQAVVQRCVTIHNNYWRDEPVYIKKLTLREKDEQKIREKNAKVKLTANYVPSVLEAALDKELKIMTIALGQPYRSTYSREPFMNHCNEIVRFEIKDVDAYKEYANVTVKFWFVDKYLNKYQSSYWRISWASEDVRKDGKEYTGICHMRFGFSKGAWKILSTSMEEDDELRKKVAEEENERLLEEERIEQEKNEKRIADEKRVAEEKRIAEEERKHIEAERKRAEKEHADKQKEYDKNYYDLKNYDAEAYDKLILSFRKDVLRELVVSEYFPSLESLSPKKNFHYEGYCNLLCPHGIVGAELISQNVSSVGRPLSKIALHSPIIQRGGFRLKTSVTHPSFKIDYFRGIVVVKVKNGTVKIKKGKVDDNISRRIQEAYRVTKNGTYTVGYTFVDMDGYKTFIEKVID